MHTNDIQTKEDCFENAENIGDLPLTNSYSEHRHVTTFSIRQNDYIFKHSEQKFN